MGGFTTPSSSGWIGFKTSRSTIRVVNRGRRHKIVATGELNFLTGHATGSFIATLSREHHAR
jgi:hypothetical protein